MQPSWQGRENPVMVPGHPVRGTSRGTQPQGYIARNQSPTRGRARGVHNSPPGGRHSPPGGRHSPPGGRHSPPGGRHSPPGGRHSPPGGRHPSPTRAPRDVSPIRPVHHRRTRRQNNRDRSESPVSPRERFQDARDKFRSLERDWQRSDRPECHARPQVHAGVCRTPSWEHKPGAGGRDTRAPHEHATRDEGVWPKSDRDTGYGSRDGLLRERPRGREYDRGYGTCDTRDSEPWHCAGSPSRVPRGRSPTKDYRVPRVKSPERPDYHRAKSMHDLNQRSVNEDDPRSCNDPRRRSMYDTAEDPRPLRESRSDRRYRSQASLRRRNSCSSGSCPSVDSYNEIPDTRRFPGLDRATARPDPLETTRGPTHFIHVNKRTYDYPVNGGTAAVHINRAQHDDYRRFRYDHTTTPQFIRTTSVPAAHY
ncbi:zinc finger CCCH domain-containing protein 13 [Cherax quadricarinatus]